MLQVYLSQIQKKSCQTFHLMTLTGVLKLQGKAHVSTMGTMSTLLSVQTLILTQILYAVWMLHTHQTLIVHQVVTLITVHLKQICLHPVMNQTWKHQTNQIQVSPSTSLQLVKHSLRASSRRADCEASRERLGAEVRKGELATITEEISFPLPLREGEYHCLKNDKLSFNNHLQGDL